MALSKAQAEIAGAAKDSTNPFFNSNYADLQSVWDACRGPLVKNGLCVIQTTELVGDVLFLKTTLAHSSGQYIFGMLPIKPVKQDPQALGSALTYGRRYALAAMVGVYQTDDDAESAMGGYEPQDKPNVSKPIITRNAELNKSVTPIVEPKNPVNPLAEAPSEVTQGQIGMLIKKAQEKGWSTDQLKGYIKKAFGHETSKTIKKAEYQLLMIVVETPYNIAIGEVETDVPNFANA